MDIHLRTLRDNQQFDDPGGVAESLGVSPSTWPLFGLVWESAVVMATLMNTFAVTGKRVLEIGCGVGLPSLVLNRRQADITATDHHPEADAYLQWNAFLNGDTRIPFVRTGWEDDCPALGRFDLLIGSDLLYQPDHPGLVAAFIDRHANAAAEVIMIDPGRGRLPGFARALAEYGFTACELPGGDGLMAAADLKGQLRGFRRG